MVHHEECHMHGDISYMVHHEECHHIIRTIYMVHKECHNNITIDMLKNTTKKRIKISVFEANDLKGNKKETIYRSLLENLHV